MKYYFAVTICTDSSRSKYLENSAYHSFSIKRMTDGAELTKYCHNKKEEKLYQLIYKLALLSQCPAKYEIKITRWSYDTKKCFLGSFDTDIDLINFLKK